MQVQDGIRPTGASRRSTAFRVVSTVALLLTAVVLPFSPAEASGDRDAPPQRGLRLLASPPDIDLDLRTGFVEPTADQRALADDLDARVRWTRFGTPASLSLSEPVRPGVAVPAAGRDAADRSDDRNPVLHPGAGPEQVARAFVDEYAALFRLSDAGPSHLEVVRHAPLAGTSAHVVTFRQWFRSPRGRLPAGDGGLITVAMTGDGRVAYVSSSAYGSPSAAVPASRLSPEDAWLAAADSLRRAATPAAVRRLGPAPDLPAWHRFSVTGFAQVQHVRLVAVGAPRGARTAIRPAYEANVVDVRNGSTLAATAFVDAVTGEVLVRHDRVDHLHALPDGALHPAVGSREVGAGDRRGGPSGHAGCPAHLLGCGVRSSLAAAVPTPVHSALLGLHDARPDPALPRRPADPWMRSGCDIAQVRPEAAASAEDYVDSLHSGLRTWLRGLGLATPDGRVTGHVHAGAETGGYPTYLGRNDAHRITLQAGLPGIESHYLFEPVAGQWYGPCADGALDPTLVAHEYLHGVTEHLVGGPDDGIVSHEGEALAEAWSDLLALEYLRRSGAGSPGTEAVGGHVSGDPVRGIRNYPIASNPLNATNLGYGGPAPWSDGEIWTAVNADLREELGTSTWLRLLLDSLPLQQSRTTMADARDALLAADRMRYDGGHDQVLWRTFARRGFGLDAPTTGRASVARADRTAPGFRSPVEPEGTLQVDVRDAEQGVPVPAKVYVGSPAGGGGVPVADTDPETALPDRIAMVPGDYELTWTAPGYGMGRATARVEAGRTSGVTVRARPNLASAAAGARILPDEDIAPVTGEAPTGEGDVGIDRTGRGSDLPAGVRPGTGDLPGTGPQDGARDSLPGVPEVSGELTDTITGLTGIGRRLLPGPHPVTPPRRPDPPRPPERVTPAERPARDDRLTSPSGAKRPEKTSGPAGQGSRAPAGPAPHDGRAVAGQAVSLIDDSERFGWTVRLERRNAPDGDTFEAAAVTIDLAGGRPHRVGQVVISALPRPERPGGRVPTSFSSLRRFAIEVCTQTVEASCTGAPLQVVGAGEDGSVDRSVTTAPSRAAAGPASTAGRWTRIYASPEDAFPAGRPRPVPSDLEFRSFDLPDAWATHVRLVVLDTQCTGNPAYQGVQSADPLTSADCRTSPAAELATIAELMVYGSDQAPVS